MITDAILAFKEASKLEVLDFSGNSTSELVGSNQTKQAYFLTNLAQFINSSTKLNCLNLEGLLLGQKLIPFISEIRESSSLNEINIVNNLLSAEDERILQELLGAGEMPHF